MSMVVWRLRLVGEAARNALIVVLERVDDVVERQVGGGQPGRVDDDLVGRRDRAADVDERDAGDLLDAAAR